MNKYKRLSALACAGVTLLGFSGVGAAVAQPALAGSPAASSSGNASYRHGVVPLVGHQPSSQISSPMAAGSNNLSYGGGVDGVGVTTGHPLVYMVFWGSQWGSVGTNSQGYTTLSGDPAGAAPYLQAFFKGVGTNNDAWSAVMTQYCEGVAKGSQTCPSTAPHVGYPSNGALAGVWVDESHSAPSQASASQIAQEAVNAANHFGNTSSAANRNVQYDILSPHGTHPDGFGTSSGDFCAWHDAANASFGLLAFTNMPYVSDVGASCGSNFVNHSSGARDGFSLVNGHEFAETITDQFPAGGWTGPGGENADKCAWIQPGASGGAFNLTLATGTFAVQATWSNVDNNGSGGCVGSYPIPGSGGGGTGGGGGGGGGGGTSGYVRIQNHATGLYIDGMGRTTNGSNAGQYSSSSSTNQQWTIVPDGSYVRIQNRATGLFLDGEGRTTNGSAVGEWSSSTSNNQQWQEVTVGSYVRFQNRATGLYIDGEGRTTNGSDLGQWSSSTSSNQQWQVVPE